MWLSVFLTLGWLVCFLFTGIASPDYWFTTVILMAMINLYVVTNRASRASSSTEEMHAYQRELFGASMLTGWILLGSLVFIVY